MNILLVGAGWIAEMVYVPFLSAMDSVNTIYVLDIDFNLTQKKFSSYDKVEAIVESEADTLKYEVVCILSPNFMHYTHINRFIDKEVTIFIEKPLCIHAHEIDALKNACVNRKLPIYVSTPFRYRHDIQSLKNTIISGVLGHIYRVEMSWIKRRGTPGSVWFTQKSQSGGGVLMDMGPHFLDLFYWLFGHKKACRYSGVMSSVFLQTGDAYADWHKEKNHTAASDVEDTAFTQLIFEDTSLALNVAWASNIENDYAQFKLYGSEAILDMLTSIGFSTNTLYKQTSVTLTKDTISQTDYLPIEDRKEPFRKMLSELVSHTQNDLADVTSTLYVMQDILAIYHYSPHIKGRL